MEEVVRIVTEQEQGQEIEEQKELEEEKKVDNKDDTDQNSHSEDNQIEQQQVEVRRSPEKRKRSEENILSEMETSSEPANRRQHSLPPKEAKRIIKALLLLAISKNNGKYNAYMRLFMRDVQHITEQRPLDKKEEKLLLEAEQEIAEMIQAQYEMVQKDSSKTTQGTNWWRRAGIASAAITGKSLFVIYYFRLANYLHIA